MPVESSRTADKHYLAANLVAASDLMADHAGFAFTPKQADPADKVFTDVGLSTDQVNVCLNELTTALPSLLESR